MLGQTPKRCVIHLFQYTITELQEEVQASNEEIMSAMYEMHACLIDGRFKSLSLLQISLRAISFEKLVGDV